MVATGYLHLKNVEIIVHQITRVRIVLRVGYFLTGVVGDGQSNLDDADFKSFGPFSG